MNASDQARVQVPALVHFKGNHVLPAIMAGLCSAAPMYPMMVTQVCSPKSDYSPHFGFVQRMLDSGALQTPHFFWHLLVIIFHKMLYVPLGVATVIVALVSHFVLGSVIARSITRGSLSGNTRLDNICVIAIPIALMLVSPIAILALVDEHLYFGYIGLSVYHNPTMTLLKPVALIGFLLIVQQQRQQKNLFVGISNAMLISVAAAFSKPNYSIILLPALVLFLFYLYTNKRGFNLVYYTVGIIAPTVAVIAWQYMFTYSHAEQSSIVLAPFDVMSHYSSFLGIKFLASVAFPLLVTGIYFRQALHDDRMILAWLLFLGGAGLTYLFAETGIRRYDGNFLWSGQIGLFILFVASALFVLERIRNDNKYWTLRHVSIGVTFFLHIFFGMIFYYTHHFLPSFYW